MAAEHSTPLEASLKNTQVSADASYYGHVRRPLLSLVEGRPKRVLEIGCAHGQTLAYLKRELGADFVAGVELVPEVAAIAKHNPDLDVVVTGDFELMSLDFPPQFFDLVIASHVLEHFKDPWSVARRLRHLLSPSGRFVGALPNVRHVKVSLPLVLFGKFEYQNEGILDWTHTKFFTRSTINSFLRSSGFFVERMEPEFMPRAALINKLTLGAFTDLFCCAYNFSARRSMESDDSDVARNAKADPPRVQNTSVRENV